MSDNPSPNTPSHEAPLPPSAAEAAARSANEASARVSDAWERAADAAIPTYDALRQSLPSVPPLRTLRVSQLDAGRLDAELTDLLREQFMGIFSFFRQGLRNALQPEIQAVVEAIVFALSIGAGRPTPGCSLLNLRYRDERSVGRTPQRTGLEGEPLSPAQRVLLGVLTVGGRYTWARVGGMAVRRRWAELRADQWQHRLCRGMRASEDLLAVANAVNLAVFLREGRYRRLVERLLACRLVYDRPAMDHAISFEYMNRELVWQELSETLLFILPLIPAARIQRWLEKVSLQVLPQSASLLGWTLGRGRKPAQGSSLPSRGCPICAATDIRVPYKASPCGHVFCYYCLRSHCIADNKFECPSLGCGKRVDAMTRHLS